MKQIGESNPELLRIPKPATSLEDEVANFTVQINGTRNRVLYAVPPAVEQVASRMVDLWVEPLFQPQPVAEKGEDPVEPPRVKGRLSWRKVYPQSYAKFLGVNARPEYALERKLTSMPTGKRAGIDELMELTFASELVDRRTQAPQVLDEEGKPALPKVAHFSDYSNKQEQSR